MATSTIQPYIPTSRDIESYWENGYWISPKLLDDDRIARLRQEAERACAGEIDGEGAHFTGPFTPNVDPGAMKRIIDGWWVNNEVRDTVLDPQLGRIAAVLMKVDAVRLFADQVLIKPGSDSGTPPKVSHVGWHQDAAYWHISSNWTNMVTAWIALQDTDLHNGGMRTLVRSHKWGVIEDSDKFYDPELDGQREYFESKGLGPWIDEPCILKAGQASFHHSLCFHASEGNRSSEPRMSIVGHYMPDGTTFRASGRFQTFLHLLGPNPKPGTALRGPCFPGVFPAEAVPTSPDPTSR